MSESVPVGHSPIRTDGPVTKLSGWEVSTQPSRSALRLADRSSLAKVLVRASPDGQVAARIGVRFGRASRDEHGTLVVGSGPGEWLLVGGIGASSELAGRVDPTDDRLVSVLDLTHGRALMRLSGVTAARVLSKVCAMNLADRATPNGTAFRSSVAAVTTDVVRDDERQAPSFLLHCERSSGQYLFDVLLDAGREFAIGRDGSFGS